MKKIDRLNLRTSNFRTNTNTEGFSLCIVIPFGYDNLKGGKNFELLKNDIALKGYIIDTIAINKKDYAKLLKKSNILLAFNNL